MSKQRSLGSPSSLAAAHSLRREQVCLSDLEPLEALVDNSLLQHDRQRFSMLETIREYARERLEASGETEPTTRRLAEQLAEAAEAFGAGCDRGEVPPIAPLENELDNIRATVRATHEWADDPLALRLAAALLWFWTASGRYAEGLRWTIETLERTKPSQDSARAEGLRTAAQLAILGGDAERGLKFGNEALALFRAAGDERQAAEVLRWLANAHSQAGDPVGALTLHAESVVLHERLGSPLHLARALRNAGEDELNLGNPARAEELFWRALELALGGRGQARRRDDVARPRRRGGRERELGAAASFYLEALRSSTEPTYAANCLAGLAAVAALAQRADQAGRIWGAVESQQRRVGEKLIHPQTLSRYTAAFEQIDETTFANAVAAGRELTLEVATREALETFVP